MRQASTDAAYAAKHDAAYAAKHDAAYAVNHQPATADSFYDIACDPLRSVAVEACAGAGKTWMLITRMVRALEAGAAADQVLAITFTKKAAGEMRERLQARLALPEHAALRLRLLEAGRSVQISTFHAWFAQLLQAAPLAVLQRLALPLQYELLEDDSALLPDLELAFYAVVASDAGLRADFAALLMQLGRSKVSGALVGLLAKRIEFELCDQGGLLEGSVESAAQLHPIFATILNSDACQANMDAAWLDARPEGRSQLGLLAKVLGQHHTTTIQGWARQLEMGLTEHDFSLVQAALLTQKQEPRKLGKMKLADIPSELQTPLSGHSGEALLLHCQAYLLEILAVQHQQDCWLYQQRMTRLGRAWLAAFAQLKRDRGLVDMSDLERAATTLLSDPELSGAVQERLDLKLRHVMIDEFQDTNPLQWQALHAWLASYAGSGGGGHGGQSRPSLFIVGDPKQSIYRFRRAEPRVFAAAQAFMQASFDAALLSCDHTRRNAPEVVAVVNAAMTEAMGESMQADLSVRPKLVEGSRIEATSTGSARTGHERTVLMFRPHTTASDALGAALCLPLIARTQASASSNAQADGDTPWRDSLSVARIDAELTLREQEAEQAADWIAAHLKPASAAHIRPSVMVLSRRHSSLALMQVALQRRGIASDKQEKTFLAHVPAVQDVLALLGALVSPQSDLDLARALKSPLFGWSDAQLMDLRALQLRDVQHPSPQSPHESALPQAAVLPARPWMAYLPSELGAQLARWQTWLHHLPPHDALQAIYDDADVLRTYYLAMPIPIRHTSQMALQALLWAALQEGGGRYLTAYGFLRALRAKTQTIKAPAAPAAAAAVQLLTIHGAKGLEADTVVLLDSDPQPIKAQSMTTLVDWQPEQPAPQRFVFLQSESYPPQCAESLLQADQRAREVEEVNTLYVAITRARSTLVVSACEAFHANPQSMWQRLNGLCEAVELDAAPLTLTKSLRSGVKDFDKLSPNGVGGGTGMGTGMGMGMGMGLHNARCSLTLPEFSAMPQAPVVSSAQQRSSEAQELNAEPASSVAQGLAESAAIGRAVHRLLQWLPVAQSPEPRDWPLHELQAAGHEFQLTPEALSTAHGMAQAMANGEAAWLWDAQCIDWQANEYELIHQGRVLRIDRLVKHRDTQVWWVIDFKSTARPELSQVLVHQMTAYGEAIQLAFHQAVQLAFVTGAGRLVTL